MEIDLISNDYVIHTLFLSYFGTLVTFVFQVQTGLVV